MPDNSDFACIICHNIVRDCRSTSCCSALLCGDCVDRNDLDICPSCRRADVQFPRNGALQRLANDLDVRCEICNQTYKHVEDHENWCPGVRITCHFAILGCEWEGQRKFLEPHLKDTHSPSCLAPGCDGVLDKIHPRDGAWCDVCQQSVSRELIALGCGKCNYLECPGCFLHRPIKSLAADCSIGMRLDVMDASAEEDLSEGNK
mmetsp:Transcript_34555/g.75949  ORF Transcript_34555/g.75949 Transcript_34555/m.75949 type:complete len:204 (-) Transcript_34555:78-689(-)